MKLVLYLDGLIFELSSGFLYILSKKIVIIHFNSYRECAINFDTQNITCLYLSYYAFSINFPSMAGSRALCIPNNLIKSCSGDIGSQLICLFPT